MIIKTKKYQLPTKTYVGIVFRNVLIQQWWVFIIYLSICGGYLWIPNWWWIIGASIALVLYMLFWLIQFMGMTQLEQGKILFQRLSYEINSQQIIIKLTERQGMPIKWAQIKKVHCGKNSFTLFMSKVQIIHLPYKLFKSQNEIRFIQTVLKRKGYLK